MDIWHLTLRRWVLPAVSKEFVSFIFKDSSWTLTLEDASNTFHRNVGNHLPRRAVTHPRRPESWITRSPSMSDIFYEF
jgi:hypothetical protein